MEHRLPAFHFQIKKRKQKASRQKQRGWKIRKRNMQDKLCTTPDKTKIHLYVSRILSSPGTNKDWDERMQFPLRAMPSSSPRFTSRFSTASGNLVVKYFQLLVNDPRFLIQSLVNAKDNIQIRASSKEFWLGGGKSMGTPPSGGGGGRAMGTPSSSN